MITLSVRPYAFHDFISVLCVLSLKMPLLLSVMNRYEKFCIDEAQYHLNRARELLTEGLRNPKKYYDEGQEFYRMMAKLFPFMILIQQYSEPLPRDLETEGNLSDTQSSIQSDSDSFVPVTPPRHLES